MVPIGLSQWLCRNERVQGRDGRTRYRTLLLPEAKAYRTLGPDDVELTLSPSPVDIRDFVDTNNAYGREEAKIVQRITEEASIEVVSNCSANGLFQSSLDCDKKIAIAIVKHLIMKQIQEGRNDEQDQDEGTFDLVERMIAARVERDRLLAERENNEREAYAQYERDAERAKEMRAVGYKASMELLRSYLSPSEAEEMDKKKTITVKNFLGRFVIPVYDHALVKQYGDDGAYVRSYCVMYKNVCLPLGDEVLMKYLLLRADPKLFIKTANAVNEGELARIGVGHDPGNRRGR